jgi:hypothetical protein
MGLLDSIRRWFSARPAEVDNVPSPGPERADETLEQERRDRAEQPRPTIATDEGYETREERDREA